MHETSDSLPDPGPIGDLPPDVAPGCPAGASGTAGLAHPAVFTDLDFPGDPERTLRVTGNGVLVNGEPLRPQAPPPLLGEHNDEFKTTTDEVTAP